MESLCSTSERRLFFLRWSRPHYNERPSPLPWSRGKRRRDRRSQAWLKHCGHRRWSHRLRALTAARCTTLEGHYVDRWRHRGTEQPCTPTLVWSARRGQAESALCAISHGCCFSIGIALGSHSTIHRCEQLHGPVEAPHARGRLHRRSRCPQVDSEHLCRSRDPLGKRCGPRHASAGYYARCKSAGKWVELRIFPRLPGRRTDRLRHAHRARCGHHHHRLAHGVAH